MSNKEIENYKTAKGQKVSSHVAILLLFKRHLPQKNKRRADKHLRFLKGLRNKAEYTNSEMKEKHSDRSLLEKDKFLKIVNSVK